VGNPGGGAGGRMPTVTGFLRNSIAAAVGRMPSGPSRPGGTVSGNGSVAAEINKWNPLNGSQINIGWTAVYARPMEYRYGFLRGAVENWDRQVERAVKNAFREIP
jgi:hypothetical protein